jgi:hypothetical protein
MIGAATLSRLRHGAHQIALDGESYRGLKSGTETLRTELAKGEKIKHPRSPFGPSNCSFPVAPLRRKGAAPLHRKVTTRPRIIADINDTP